jgi:H+-transporting ATPase
MYTLLGIATVLGLYGVVESYGILYLARNVLGLSDPSARTMIYLELSISGHLTVFVARTEGRFWSIRPSWILVGAVVGTQLLATVISVYGLALVTPIGWITALVVWAYCLVWFPIEDEVKLLSYRVIDWRGPGFLSELLKR